MVFHQILADSEISLEVCYEMNKISEFGEIENIAKKIRIIEKNIKINKLSLQLSVNEYIYQKLNVHLNLTAKIN